MTLDKQTRLAIASAVKKAAIEANEIYSERWLTASQLTKEIGFFNEDFMKHHAKKLPRECVRFMDEDGVWHQTNWRYPLKRILRMVADGELRILN